jgi:rod shape-determining protein MreC
MQVLSTTARNAALLLALLMGFFLVMSLQVNRGETLAAARGAVRGVTSPFQRIGSTVGSFFSGTWSRYTGLVGADRENESLRRRVAELEQRLSAAEAARRENRRLRALLGAHERGGADWIEAKVAAREFAHRYETVTLNRGSQDGVTVDAPVVGPGAALVGRVISVSPWTSLVQLITDPLAGIGARLSESRATGLIGGNNGPSLRLEYVSTRAEVRIGEAIVTSGDDDIYPADLLIGHVVEVDVGPAVPGVPSVPLLREETALFKLIEVEPAIDMPTLENVLILRAAEREP